MSALATQSTQAHTIRVSAQLIMVESGTTPGRFYPVTPTSCPCKSYQFGAARDPHFVCKHMDDAFPRLCCNCRTERVQVAGDWCPGCMNLKHAGDGQAAVAVAELVVQQETTRRARFVNRDNLCQDDYEWCAMTGQYADERPVSAATPRPLGTITRIATRSVLDFD